MSTQPPVFKRTISSERIRRAPIGEWLVANGHITREQLELALEQQKRTQRLLGEVVVDLGFLSEESMASSLAAHAGVDHIHLNGIDVEPAILNVIPEALSRKHGVLPIARRGNSLRLAMSNVLNVVAIDEVEKAAKVRVSPCYASRRDITAAIERLYSRRERFEDVFDRLVRHAEQRQGTANDDLVAATNAGAIVELVDATVERAIDLKATDIHVEPEEQLTRIRYRVDGLLQSGPTLPKILQAPAAARIKVMAKLNISESRLPQDGKIRFETKDKKEVDLRVSTFLTNHGENVVLRVLNRDSVVVALDQIGFAPDDLARFLQLLKRPNGIILVTGPTGAGKTTTLYAALSQLNTVDKNIMTIEDPIEYEIPLIRQSQINLKAGITFANGLRALMRQDPDIILIGETRDEETAEMATRASMTGHLVFTTLHTNSSVGAIPRLVDLKVEPFLIGSCVIGSLAQRLVRVLCKVCKEATEPRPEHARTLEKVADRFKVKPTVYRAVGCDACKQSGYKGRTGIYELLEVSGDVRNLIMDGQVGAGLEKAARAQMPRTLYEDGLLKIAQGITTFSELERVVESDLWKQREG